MLLGLSDIYCLDLEGQRDRYRLEWLEQDLWDKRDFTLLQIVSEEWRKIQGSSFLKI